MTTPTRHFIPGGGWYATTTHNRDNSHTVPVVAWHITIEPPDPDIGDAEEYVTGAPMTPDGDGMLSDLDLDGTWVIWHPDHDIEVPHWVLETARKNAARYDAITEEIRARRNRTVPEGET